MEQASAMLMRITESDSRPCTRLRFSASHRVVNEECKRLDTALIRCFLPMNKQERTSTIKQLLTLVHSCEAEMDVDMELGRISSLLFQSAEWLSVPGHIDCLKFFLLTGSVQELIPRVFLNGAVYT